MRLSLKIGLVTALFAVGFIPISLAILSWLPPERYDRNSADFKYIRSVLESNRKVIVLANIHKGDWQFICVLGPYNDPVRVLRSESKKRGVNLIAILEKPSTSLSQADAAISLVDHKGHGRTIFYPGAFSLAGEHAKKCYGTETKEIALPMNEIDFEVGQ